MSSPDPGCVFVVYEADGTRNSAWYDSDAAAREAAKLGGTYATEYEIPRDTPEVTVLHIGGFESGTYQARCGERPGSLAYVQDPALATCEPCKAKFAAPQTSSPTPRPSIEVVYSPAEGIVLRGTTKAMAPGIKRAGRWRWFRDGEFWFFPRTRDTVQPRWKVEQEAKTLRATLPDVDVVVRYELDEVRPAEVREEEARERSERRAERLDEKAGKLARESSAANASAHSIADGIPMGQPILVGHHSENRHRRDIARIHSRFEKAAELDDEARATKGAARSARETNARRDDPAAIIRRVARLESELRDVVRKLAGTSRNGVEYGKPAEGQWRVELLAHESKLADEIGHLRAKLETAGVDLRTAREKYAAGQTVRTRWGEAVVLRVNRRTLTVQLEKSKRFLHPPSGIFKEPLDRLLEVERKEPR